jgi:hypothetical protein
MSLKTDLEAAVAQAQDDGALMRAIVQGPESGGASTVNTDSRVVSTLAKTSEDMHQAFLDLLAELGAIVPPDPVLGFSYIFSEGQPGFYTFGTPPAVAAAIDQGGAVGDATQVTVSAQPTIDTAKMNGLDALKLDPIGASQGRLNVQGARSILRGQTWLELRLTHHLDAAPASPQGQTIIRFDSGTAGRALLSVIVMDDLKVRLAVRLSGTESGIQSMESVYPLILGVANVVRIRMDTIAKKVFFAINWHDFTTDRPLIPGVGPGWNGGFTAFEDVEALADPTIGRPDGEVDWWTTWVEFYTGKPLLTDSNTWWIDRQAEVDAPLPSTTIDARARATKNQVVEARAGAVFQITGGTSGPGTNRIASVSIDGVAVTSGAVDWATSHAATATALAANINAHSSTYEAVAHDAKVFVKAIAGKAFGNGLALLVDVDGDVTVDDTSQSLTLGGVGYASGTVKAGRPNGDINLRLLDWEDQTTEHVGLFTIDTVSGDTGTARPWDGWFWVPRGAHIIEARLGAEHVSNATIMADDGRFAGLRVMDDGQSNMKLVIARLGQGEGSVFPFESSRAFEMHRRNTGDGWHPLHGRVTGGGGVYPLTGEVKPPLGDDTLNEGAGANGSIQMGIVAASLVDYPIGTSFIAIGASGTETRLPPSASPPDGGVNWIKSNTKLMSEGGGGYNVDVIRLQDGENEANGHSDPGFYKRNVILMVEDRRVRAGWMVPFLIGVMGPTATNAADIDPLTGRTWAEGIRKAQLELVYGEGKGPVGITGATKANPGVLEVLDHPFRNGDYILVAGVVGMTELNGNRYVLTVVDEDHVSIGVNTSSFGTYVSDGTLTEVDLAETYLYDIPLDTDRAALTGGGKDTQHGAYDRYQIAVDRGIRNALWVSDPATFPTGYQGPRPISVTGEIGSNDVHVTFDLHGGTTAITGSTASTGFTGVTLAINGSVVTITESDADGDVARFRYSGTALAEGDTIAWENLASAAPDHTNVLTDNGSPKSVAHPTLAALTHTVAA